MGLVDDRRVTLMREERRGGKKGHTELPALNFFSVPMTAPLLWAALRADLPRTTVSRDAPAPRVLLPIFVTVSQSSMVGELIEMDLCVLMCIRGCAFEGEEVVCCGGGGGCLLMNNVEERFDMRRSISRPAMRLWFVVGGGTAFLPCDSCAKPKWRKSPHDPSRYRS